MKNLSFFFLFSFYALVTTAQAYDPLFIFEQFSNAKIHFKNRSVTVAAMNYDAVNDKMYFKNNGELMELSNQEMIDSISWAANTFSRDKNQRFSQHSDEHCQLCF
mgnify:CR=1 FL=1